MIDWSARDRGRDGLFAAVCYRRRGLPLLSWVSTAEELDPSQNRLEEFFLGRLLRHLPVTIRPLLLADRSFGRASLIRFLQQMPHHTGYPVDYVVRLKGDVVVSRVCKSQPVWASELPRPGPVPVAKINHLKPGKNHAAYAEYGDLA